MREDEMVGWHHGLNGREFEQALGVDEGQGSLVCYSPWHCKVSDMNEQLCNNKIITKIKINNISSCPQFSSWSFVIHCFLYSQP